MTAGHWSPTISTTSTAARYRCCMRCLCCSCCMVFIHAHVFILAINTGFAQQGLPEIEFLKLALCHTICDVLLCSSQFAGFLKNGGKLMAAAVLAAAWMIQVRANYVYLWVAGMATIKLL